MLVGRFAFDFQDQAGEGHDGGLLHASPHNRSNSEKPVPAAVVGSVKIPTLPRYKTRQSEASL